MRRANTRIIHTALFASLRVREKGKRSSGDLFERERATHSHLWQLPLLLCQPLAHRNSLFFFLQPTFSNKEISQYLNKLQLLPYAKMFVALCKIYSSNCFLVAELPNDKVFKLIDH